MSKLYKFLLFFSLIFIIISISFFKSKFNQKNIFSLNPGTFVGKLELDQNYPFILEIDEKNRFIVSLNNEVINLDLASKKVLINSRTLGEILLKGDCKDKKNCSGQASVESKELTGSWSLSKTFTQLSSNFSVTNNEVVAIYNIGKEILDSKKRLTEMSQDVLDKEIELKELKNLSSSDEQIKDISEKKYTESLEKLILIKEELSKKKLEAKELNNRVSLIQKISYYGKLVVGSRKANKKDLEWINRIKSIYEQNKDENFQLKLRKAERILNLKRKLAEERDRIFELNRKGVY